MTSYVSTRGGAGVELREALFRGLAADGGLYVPATSTSLPGQAPTQPVSPSASARWALPALFPTVAPAVLEEVATSAFTFPLPLVEVEPGVHVLELFHGPTAAFKDVGARVLARLAAALTGDGEERTVLVATSGDTGGAVASAFHRLEGFQVVALFPLGRVSERQRRQMTTLAHNVRAVAVRGSFDDCQRLAKEAFSDDALSRRYRLMSANSINIGRLLPQAVYYVHATAALGWTPVRFAVPSGNLGNLCAGLFAHRMGMPAAGFLAATNRNRAFADYLAKGEAPLLPSVPTLSTAMDVGLPSNLERIRWLYDGRVDAVRRDVTAVPVSDDRTLECMRDVHARTGYALDPHSAVAYDAVRRHDQGADVPTVVVATAHPAKFPEVTTRAYGEEVELPDALAGMADAEEAMTEIDPTLDALQTVLAAGPS